MPLQEIFLSVVTFVKCVMVVIFSRWFWHLPRRRGNFTFKITQILVTSKLVINVFLVLVGFDELVRSALLEPVFFGIFAFSPKIGPGVANVLQSTSWKYFTIFCAKMWLQEFCTKFVPLNDFLFRNLHNILKSSSVNICEHSIFCKKIFNGTLTNRFFYWY